MQSLSFGFNSGLIVNYRMCGKMSLCYFIALTDSCFPLNQAISEKSQEEKVFVKSSIHRPAQGKESHKEAAKKKPVSQATPPLKGNTTAVNGDREVGCVLQLMYTSSTKLLHIPLKELPKNIKRKFIVVSHHLFAYEENVLS